MIQGDLWASLQCGFFLPLQSVRGISSGDVTVGLDFRKKNDLVNQTASFCSQVFVSLLIVWSGATFLTQTFYFLIFLYFFFSLCHPLHMSSNNLEELKQGNVLQQENMMQNI